MTKSKIFLFFCLSFIGGIFLGSIVIIPLTAKLGVLILGMLLISVLWPYKKLVVVGFCLVLLVIGIGRYQQAESKIVSKYDQEVILIGIVKAEPDIREKSMKLEIERVLITTNRYPEYQYGDKLVIKGEIKTPPRFSDFNYQGYLAKEGIYSVMSFPEIELIEKNQGNFIYAKILNFKNRIRNNINQDFSPPQSTVLGAMVLGDKSRISASFKEKLNIAGLRHITAISGMHITILSVILMNLLIGLGFWRGQAFYLTLILLILFIIMIGFPSSAVRAGIMGGLLLIAQKLGRMNQASRAIVLAAVLMLLINPLLLRFDVGFQLSFLAAMGIIFLSPFLQKWFSLIPSHSLKSIVAMTLAAQVFTLPILVYNFGRISLIAPLTNVLVVPLMPVILGLGLLFGLLASVWLPLGKVLAFLLWPFITYLVKVVEETSKWPGASLIWQGASWIWPVIFYFFLLGIIYWLNRRKKLSFFNY